MGSKLEKLCATCCSNETGYCHGDSKFYSKPTPPAGYDCSNCWEMNEKYLYSIYADLPWFLQDRKHVHYGINFLYSEIVEKISMYENDEPIAINIYDAIVNIYNMNSIGLSETLDILPSVLKYCTSKKGTPKKRAIDFSKKLRLPIEFFEKEVTTFDIPEIHKCAEAFHAAFPHSPFTNSKWREEKAIPKIMQLLRCSKDDATIIAQITFFHWESQFAAENKLNDIEKLILSHLRDRNKKSKDLVLDYFTFQIGHSGYPEFSYSVKNINVPSECEIGDMSSPYKNSWGSWMRDSWKLQSKNCLSKETDSTFYMWNSILFHNKILGFWGINELDIDSVYDIFLLLHNKTFHACIKREEAGLLMLCWDDDLKDALNLLFDFSAISEYPHVYFKHVKLNIFEMIFSSQDDEFLEKDSFFTEDMENDVKYQEGRKLEQYNTKYERNPKNRVACIKIHGTKCAVCDFDFEETYGKLGKDYIEVHHKKPLSEYGKEVIIDPKNDMIPVCSNCHRMLHRKKDKIMSVEELRETIEKINPSRT